MCYHLIRSVSNLGRVQTDFIWGSALQRCGAGLAYDTEGSANILQYHHKELNQTLLWLFDQVLWWWIKHVQAYITCEFIPVNGSILRSERLLTEFVRKLCLCADVFLPAESFHLKKKNL